MNVQVLLLIAFISSISRAGLNVIDRFQLGVKKESIVKINFLNNIIPVILILVISLIMNWEVEILKNILNINTILFSCIVQMVAFGYSYIFKHLNISQSIIASKFSDLLIPIGILLTTGYFNISDYWFSVITTLVCCIIFVDKKNTRNKELLIKCIILISSFLVIQASMMPILTKQSTNFVSTLQFISAAIIWRFLISFVILIKSRKKNITVIAKENINNALRNIISPIINLRGLLTLLTQATFVIATSAKDSAIAWSILNSTSLYAVVLARIFLKEKSTKLEIYIVTIITILVVIKGILK